MTRGSGGDPGSFSWGTRLPELETPRLRLRHLRDADIPALFAVFGDPEVMRYWSCPAFAEVEAVREMVRRIHAGFRERSFFQWGVARREDDRALGTCTLYRLEPVHRRAEIGYILGRESWGRGLGGEAVGALVDFAFGPLGLARLEADVDPRNTRSLRMLERLGFQREGYLRERHRIAGEVQDTVFLGLLESDRPARAEDPSKGTA